jgi:hypothetical protein
VLLDLAAWILPESTQLNARIKLMSLLIEGAKDAEME